MMPPFLAQCWGLAAAQGGKKKKRAWRRWNMEGGWLASGEGPTLSPTRGPAGVLLGSAGALVTRAKNDGADKNRNGATNLDCDPWCDVMCAWAGRRAIWKKGRRKTKRSSNYGNCDIMS
ncbi:hypothetical protein M431DRAFT_301575 [Trichoderma harzianum CBS 226.95]|uniref:Uncharacterized protein n=1 Tax=Trichoderma harzianum CBS 226.95 TaxID=983964 RepID=A0A2T4AQM1_TRIHA|nr:hypothetical protein M431DRAFT_301575 [Trichoderma harzianum CBS 226.95]PTB59366.1 hypothetical protein M431DRAFT_301575 [Trichoderma harzianum CBS 226.95]